MGAKPSIIFDTSGWNQFLQEPSLDSLVAGLKAGFFIRLTGTNIEEMAATQDSRLRKSLLHLCRGLADDYLSPYHWITNELIASYSKDPNLFD
jgi:hypothetical protein